MEPVGTVGEPRGIDSYLEGWLGDVVGLLAYRSGKGTRRPFGMAKGSGGQTKRSGGLAKEPVGPSKRPVGLALGSEARNGCYR